MEYGYLCACRGCFGFRRLKTTTFGGGLHGLPLFYRLPNSFLSDTSDFVELKKFDNELIHIKNTLDRWITFLNRASELEKDKLPQELNVPEIRKAVDTVERMSLTKKERVYYEGRKKIIRDDEGVIKFREEKAEEKGKIAEREDIAIEMIKDGETNDKIKKYTKFTEEEINLLRYKLNKK